MTQAIKAFLEADALLRASGEEIVPGSAKYPTTAREHQSLRDDFIAAASLIGDDLAKMVEDMRVVKEALEGILPQGGTHYDHVRSALTRLKPYEKLVEKEGGE